MEGRIDLSDDTKDGYGCVARHLVEWGKHKSLAALDLRDYALVRRDAGKAPRRIALELTIIGVMFRWARRERHIPNKSILRVPRLKVDPGKFVGPIRLRSSGRFGASVPAAAWPFTATLTFVVDKT